MIEFDEHVSQRSHLDLTPLIDCVFLLLIFFMLTSVFAKPSMPLNLPETETAAVSREMPLRIEISQDGRIFMNNVPIEPGQLYESVVTHYQNANKKEVHLLSDKGVSFGKVIEVIDTVKKAGVETISVVTEQKTEK